MSEEEPTASAALEDSQNLGAQSPRAGKKKKSKRRKAPAQ